MVFLKEFIVIKSKWVGQNELQPSPMSIAVYLICFWASDGCSSFHVTHFSKHTLGPHPEKLCLLWLNPGFRVNLGQPHRSSWPGSECGRCWNHRLDLVSLCWPLRGPSCTQQGRTHLWPQRFGPNPHKLLLPLLCCCTDHVIHKHKLINDLIILKFWWLVSGVSPKTLGKRAK